MKKPLLESNGVTEEVDLGTSAAFNRACLFTWPIFSLFLLTQPLTSNYLNNLWYSYSAEYDLYAANGALQKKGYSNHRAGICITPADQFVCADGQNFTALAMKYRGVPFGCGCGEGVLGEGLCPMTFYGYTLSDFVSTEPAIAAMLGLGFFPLLGTWQNTKVINAKAKPGRCVGAMHFFSMFVFQMCYIFWGMASDCIFPTAHAVLTVAFLGGFLVHWLITAHICIVHWGLGALEARITFAVALFSIAIISAGAMPRVFLTINGATGKAQYPNLVRGVGKYAFWFAEAAGLSVTFGCYPLILLGFCMPPYARQKPREFRIWNNSRECPPAPDLEKTSARIQQTELWVRDLEAKLKQSERKREEEIDCMGGIGCLAPRK